MIGESMRAALAAAALLWALLGGESIQAASHSQIARTHHGGLVLTLRAEISGATVVARATLKNNGPNTLQYLGGCAPPEVQIRATNAAGNLVYGYVPPRVTCQAITILSLAPGAHLTVHARFRIAAPVDVRARIRGTLTTPTYLETPPIRLAPAARG